MDIKFLLYSKSSTMPTMIKIIGAKLNFDRHILKVWDDNKTVSLGMSANYYQEYTYVPPTLVEFEYSHKPLGMASPSPEHP